MYFNLARANPQQENPTINRTSKQRLQYRSDSLRVQVVLEQLLKPLRHHTIVHYWLLMVKNTFKVICSQFKYAGSKKLQRRQ